jgi:hypothetical protein
MWLFLMRCLDLSCLDINQVYTTLINMAYCIVNKLTSSYGAKVRLLAKRRYMVRTAYFLSNV